MKTLPKILATVSVMPKPDDIFTYPFVGTVIDIRDENGKPIISVEDAESDIFDVGLDQIEEAA